MKAAIPAEQKMVSSSSWKLMGSLAQSSMHVCKPRHVPHEAKSQFAERQGNNKRTDLEISFSLLWIPWEGCYFPFLLKLLDSTENCRSWCADVMSPKYSNLQSGLPLWTVSVGFSSSHINIYSVNAYLWASHLLIKRQEKQTFLGRDLSFQE